MDTGTTTTDALCGACSTLFDAPLTSHPKECPICEDPRQYVPSSGQSWTSLVELQQKGTKNKFERDKRDPRVWSITSVPKVPIGQRAVLIQTDYGNVLWDLIAYIDRETIQKIRDLGGLKAIVISHPHYYTTHTVWAAIFGCPVYVSIEDRRWLMRQDHPVSPCRRFIDGKTLEIVPGVTAVKTGGHFPGSLVLHWEKHLFIADTIMTVPSGLCHVRNASRATAFSFMWSIPNMIPLPPDEIVAMWEVLEPLDFDVTHGAFAGMDVRPLSEGDSIKALVLKSMQNQISAMGYRDHWFLQVTSERTNGP